MPELTFEALSARYPGGIPAADRPRAEAALEDAEHSVRLVSGLTGGEALPGALASLTLRAARREFSNPLSLHSETLADYTRGMSSNRSMLTAEERAEVDLIMGRSPIASVPMSSQWSTDTVRRITPTESWSLRWPDGGSA